MANRDPSHLGPVPAPSPLQQSRPHLPPAQQYQHSKDGTRGGERGGRTGICLTCPQPSSFSAPAAVGITPEEAEAAAAECPPPPAEGGHLTRAASTNQRVRLRAESLADAESWSVGEDGGEGRAWLRSARHLSTCGTTVGVQYSMCGEWETSPLSDYQQFNSRLSAVLTPHAVTPPSGSSEVSMHPPPLLTFSLLVAGPRGPGKLTRSCREASILVSEPPPLAASQPRPSLLARGAPPLPGGEADRRSGSLTMGTRMMGVEKVPVGGWEGRLLAVT